MTCHIMLVSNCKQLQVDFEMHLEGSGWRLTSDTPNEDAQFSSAELAVISQGPYSVGTT